MAFVAFDGKLDETLFKPFDGKLDGEQPTERTWGEAISDLGQGLKKGVGTLAKASGEVVDDPANFAGATATGLAEGLVTGPVRLASWAKKKLTGDGSLPFDAEKGAAEISSWFAPARDKYARGLAESEKQSDENNGVGSALRTSGDTTVKEASKAMSASSKARDKAYEKTEGIDALYFLAQNPGKIADMVAENAASQAPLLLMGMGAGGIVRSISAKEAVAAKALLMESAEIKALTNIATTGATQEIKQQAAKSINDAVKAAMTKATEGVIKRTEPYIEALGIGGESSLTMAQTASSIGDSVARAKLEDLEKLPEFQQYMTQYGNELDARRALAAKLKLEWAPMAALGTATGSVLTGGALAQAKALAGQVGGYKAASKNTFREMGEESIQNPLENAMQYGAESQVDPDAKLDPIKAAIEGAATAAGQSGATQFAKPVFNTLTGRSNDAPLTPTVNPLVEKLSASGGIVSNAVLKAKPEPAEKDAFTLKAEAYKQAIQDSGLLDDMRKFGAQHTEAFIDALGKVNNTRLPATTRQAAMDTIETGLRWIDQGQTDDVQGTGSPYSTDLANTDQVESDSTRTDAAPGSELDQLGFDDRTVDALPGDLPQLPNNPSPTLSELFPGEDNGAFGPTTEPPGLGPVSPSDNANPGLGAQPESVDGLRPDATRSPADGMGTPAGLPTGTPDAALNQSDPSQGIFNGNETSQAPRQPDANTAAEPAASADAAAQQEVAGKPINGTWTAFTPESGTLNIPRKLMPQIKSEHRGAMSSFLAARGVETESEVVPATSLKPTQAEFAPKKVKQAEKFEGNDRPILVSSDGHILDGHHQWLAKRNKGENVKVTRLNAPISVLLELMQDFPSAGMTKPAEPISQPIEQTNGPQEEKAVTPKPGQPQAPRTTVTAPVNITAAQAPVEVKGPAIYRKRVAQIAHFVNQGFTQVEESPQGVALVNPKTNQAHPLAGPIRGIEATAAKNLLAKVTPVGYAEGQTTGVKNDGTGATGAGVGAASQGDSRVGNSNGRSGDTGLSTPYGRHSATGAAAVGGTTGARNSGLPPNLGRPGANEGVVETQRDSEQSAGMPSGVLRGSDATGNGDRDAGAGLSGDASGMPGQPPSIFESKGRSLRHPGRDAVVASNIANAAGLSDLLIDESDQALNRIINVFAGFSGKRAIPAASESSTSDGMTSRASGGLVINTKNQEMKPSRTVVHETHHWYEDVPEIASKISEMWALVPHDVRADYFEGYLEKGLSYNKVMAAAKSGNPKAQALYKKLKSEFMADFDAGNFHDRAWLEALAKKKPHLFAKFIEEWIPLLGDMIRLVHEHINARTTSLRFKDIDALMKLHGFGKELVAMKELAMDVAEEYTKQNPGFAKKTNIGDVLNSGRDQDLDFLDELNAELADELNGVVSDESIKAQGLHAEAAYADPAWDKKAGGLLRTEVPNLYNEGNTAMIQLEPEGRLWGGMLLGTWIGPANTEKTGYATLKFAKAFVKRFIASKDLLTRGFDIASAVTPEQKTSLVSKWKELNLRDDAHRYTPGDAALPLKALAAKMGITRTHDVGVQTESYDDNNRTIIVTFKDKASAEEQVAILDLVKAGGKWTATANTADLRRGGMGAGFYQMVGEYAAGRDITITPDSSLSGVNSYRRTEQMLSAALRTGKSNVMVPHAVQRIYGFNFTANTEAEHGDNVARLLLAGLRNAKELAPGLDKLHYQPETGEFTTGKGKNAEDEVKKMLLDIDARSFGLGRSTLARAVMTKDMLAGQEVKTESFKEPVLYSARDTAEIEYETVKSQYANTPQWLKAPNGKPTNLTERQWIQTRTDSFKSWFGDWEKGDIWNRDDVSKAVDDNGEPLVVYHGTDKGGFMAFDKPGGKQRGDLGIFTTPNREMAASYIRKGREQDLTPGDLDADVAEWWSDEGGANEEVSFSDLTQEQADEARDRYQDEVGQYETKPGIYAVFMNIRNPNEEHFEGALWSGERPEQWVVVNEEGEQVYGATGKAFFDSEDAAQALADESGGQVEPAPEHWLTTDDVVREAIRDSYDGAIIREVIDDGGGRSSYSNEPSDVFVALEPNQLKSADWNDGQFGKSNDIRYSAKDDMAASDEDDSHEGYHLGITAQEREMADKVVLSREELTRIAAQAKKFKVPYKDLNLEVRRIKSRFPESDGWAPIVFDKLDEKDMKKKSSAANWVPASSVMFTAIPYQFHLDANGKPDKATKQARVGVLADALAKEIEDKFKAAQGGDKVAATIMGQAGWYRELRSKMRMVFGGFADYFAQLLGPTSANNPVEPNFKYAMEAINAATSGKWDGIIRDVAIWKADIRAAATRLDDFEASMTKADKKAVEALVAEVQEKFGKGVTSPERTEFQNTRLEQVNPGLYAARQNLKDASLYKGEEPFRTNGKRFGMATTGILNILANEWGDKKPGDAPKTKNYYQNIIGRTVEATIDVWAARTLRRLASAKITPLKRIPKPAEIGVQGNILATGKDIAGSEFGFGQDVFRLAAEKLRASGIDLFKNTTPDEIQAMVWFIEKESWTQSGWTTVMGEGGSLEYEMLLSGNMDRDQVDGLRKTVRSSAPNEPDLTGVDPVKAESILQVWRDEVADWKTAKNDAIQSLNGMMRYPDRYVAGVTLEIPGDKPLDSEMAALGRALEAGIIASPGVVSMRAQTSVGDFMGDKERTLDVEFVARNGYDVLPFSEKLKRITNKEGQQATFLSRVIGPDEGIDPLVHRPGIEVYFTANIDQGKVDAMIEKINASGIHGMTMATEGRRTPSSLSGGDQPVVGIRMQHIPEFMLGDWDGAYRADMTDAEILVMVDEAKKRMKSLVGDLKRDGLVSSVELHFYETEVNFYGDYDYGRGTTEGTGPVRSGQWSGRTIGDGLQNANRGGEKQRVDALARRRGRISASRQIRRSGGSSIQSSARDTGPSDRRSPGDGATVRQAVHYGKVAGLTQLAGRSNGTGIRGAEDQRLKEATDPRIKQRVYFYAPVTGGIPQPEVGLGGSVYQTDLENIYDPRVTKNPVRGAGNSFESAVLDAGYDGYTDPESGVVVMLGRDVPVKHIGSIGDFKVMPRLIERIIPKNTTREEGNELVRKPVGTEMAELAHPAKQAKIREAAPSFHMQYGYFRVKANESAKADAAITEFSPTFRFEEVSFSKRDDRNIDALKRLRKCLS
jgi:hypothetical protein